jgi:outer membrane protein assembly factor BamD
MALRSPARSFALLALVALALPALEACHEPPPRDPTNALETARLDYEDAVKLLDGKSYLEASSALKNVAKKHAYTKYGRLAQLRLADLDFAQDKIAEALKGYRAYVKDHPADKEEVAYARSRIAEGEYAQIATSFLLAATEERDQTPILEAYRELRGFMRDFSDSPRMPKFRDMLDEVVSRLVGHELAVAAFYMNRANYTAAEARVNYALFTYVPPRFWDAEEPMATIEPVLTDKRNYVTECLLLRAEIARKQHAWAKARDTYELIVSRYGDHPAVAAARAELASLPREPSVATAP